MSHLGIESQNAQSWLEIGDLAALLDAEERLRLLVNSGVPVVRAEATYIRLKPGSGALVGLELRLSTPDGEISLPGYVRTHAPARAAELARKKDPWSLDMRLHRTLEGLTGLKMPVGQVRVWQDFWKKEESAQS